MTEPLAIAFVKAAWHADIVDQALAGFEEDMRHSGAQYGVTVYDVPGAFELPLQAKRLGSSGRFDAIVVAALVVDGGIYRHDFVAQTVVDGLMRAQLDTDVPTFSVSLTPHQFQPTHEHEGFFREHFAKKGAEAARAVRSVLSLDTKRS